MDDGGAPADVCDLVAAQVQFAKAEPRGRAHRAERHRHGVEHQAHRRDAQRGEPKPDQNGRGQRGGCAKPAQPLDEEREGPRNEHELRDRIWAQGAQPRREHPHRARVFERFEEHDGPEDDAQRRERREQAVDHRRVREAGVPRRAAGRCEEGHRGGIGDERRGGRAAWAGIGSLRARARSSGR